MKKKHSDHIRQSVKRVYNAISAQFSQSRHYQWAEFDHFLSFLPSSEKKIKVLDLGCGNGRLSEKFKKESIDYVGLDQSEGLISQAKEKYPDRHFVVADMLDTGLPNESFDAIFSIAAFHHIPSKKLRKKAVREMHRVLKKDGFLIITVWNLFQKKYFKNLLSAIFSFLIHFGSKFSWNDLWIKWSKYPEPRYYHAFLPHELIGYFRGKEWKMRDFYFSKKGKRVSFFRSFNLCIVVQKIK